MKKKYLLGALAIPAFFAACTNEDFEQGMLPMNPANGSLDGRAKGYVELSVNKDKSTVNEETRVVGDYNSGSIQWLWQDNQDKIGAVLVDYKTPFPAYNEDYVITNYPFAPQIEKASPSAYFKTETAVVQGAYMFYSQYDGQNTSRRNISHTIPRIQTVKYDIDKGEEQIGSDQALNGYNFFVSPIVDLAVKDGENIQTPLTMTSAHSILHINLTSDFKKVDGGKDYYGEGVGVYKIVLKPTDTSTNFNRELTLSPQAIGQLQYEVWQSVPYGTPLKDMFDCDQSNQEAVIRTLGEDKALVNDALNLVLAKMTEKGDKGQAAVSNIGNQVAVDGGSENELIYVLDEPFVFRSDADVMDLLVMMPAGEYPFKTGLPEYDGKGQGALRMTVYTTEGTYDCYLGTKLETGQNLIAHRSEKINIVKKLIIGGGKTNVNLFDPNEGFDIETTADYNFAVEYVRAHSRDFGNSSSWKKPMFNFRDGAEVEVDVTTHDFLPYPVEYSGEAIITLKNVGPEYDIDTENVLLGQNGGSPADMPTINVENSENTFVISDDYRIELTTKGNVKVSGEAKVQFDNLDAEGTLTTEKNTKVSITGRDVTVGKGVTVAADATSFNVTVDGSIDFAGTNTFGIDVNLTANQDVKLNNTTVAKNLDIACDEATTTGGLTLNEAAKMNVDADYINENGSKVVINKDAGADLLQNATNYGEINVEVSGKLTNTVSGKTFTNLGTFNLSGGDAAMNHAERSVADIAVLVNGTTAGPNTDAIININAGDDNKGTYGGKLTVTKTLTNNIGANINIDGELWATTAKGTNYGTVSLLDNPYALVKLNGTNFKSVNDGKILLTTPAEYEMFDNYYSQHNDLSGVVGDIVAVLDNALLETVWANHVKYAAMGQKTAWQVINKIEAKGALNFKKVYTAAPYNTKNLVLPAGSAVNFAENSQVANFKNVVVSGAAKFSTKDENTKGTVNVASIAIAAGAAFDNGAKVTTNILPAGTAEMLDIEGTLNNYGALHTTIAEKQAINAVVATGAKLVNFGAIGSKEVAPKYYSDAEIARFKKVTDLFKNFNTTYTVRKNMKSTPAVLENTKRTWTLFQAWVGATFDSQGIWEYNGDYYKIHNTDPDDYNNLLTGLTADDKAFIAETTKKITDVNGNTLFNLGKNVTISTSKKYVKTSGYIQDYIAIDVNNGEVVLNNTGSKAYGYIKQNNGTKVGEFTEDYKARLAP